MPNKIEDIAEEGPEETPPNRTALPGPWVWEGSLPLALEELGLSKLSLEAIEPVGDAANHMIVLEELFINQRRRLRSFVRKRLSDENAADDIVQQTFLGAYRSWHSFRGESTPETWLFGIAMNLIRDLTSRSPGARIKFASEDEIEEEAIPELDPLHICMRSQFSHKLKQAVDSLPPDMKETLRLVVDEGLSYQEAADALEIPVGTVRSRLSRTRAALKTLMDKYLE
ncbi:MAG: hypothetical protein RIR70_1770 [Pseudomonadota bacterium]